MRLRRSENHRDLALQVFFMIGIEQELLARGVWGLLQEEAQKIVFSAVAAEAFPAPLFGKAHVLHGVGEGGLQFRGMAVRIHRVHPAQAMDLSHGVPMLLEGAATMEVEAAELLGNAVDVRQAELGENQCESNGIKSSVIPTPRCCGIW